MKANKNNQCPKSGCPEYVNRNCWLANTLNNSPSKRCRYCHLRFHNCLFFQYLLISLVLVSSLLVVSFLIEGKISQLVIICIFVLVIIYGYFFNQSTEKIIEANFSERKAKEELEELTEKLEEKVDAQTRDLKKANIRLQELDKQKTEFLSIAAHQLRTPLSILKGYLELLNDGAYGKVTSDTKGIFKNMDESNERLIKLVDEFLDISRIEQGRTKFVFKPVNICEILTQVVEELRLRATEKNLTINCSMPKGQKIEVDEEKIRNVVFNFIDNAIKYSDAGEIKVFVKYENNGVSVKVVDSGLGFDKKDQANFYQKFYRGDNVKGINVNGTGLGLFVCSKFIEAHGGKVWAKSAGLGNGSEFGFWVPKKPAKTIVNTTSQN